jgi:arylsulfatase A-like enzyme
MNPATLKKHLAAAAAALLMAVLTACTGATDDQPGLILIAIDTLRTDALGCYDPESRATPNLDRFAAESVLFKAAYSQSPWTLPSFASLFTSTLPSVHGARGSFQEHFYPIRKSLTRAAESFKEQGYRTAAIVNNIFLKGTFGFKEGFDEYDFFPAEINKIRKANEVTHLAREWLEDHVEVGDPCFLFLHYFDPHFAYLPPREFLQKFGGKSNDKIRQITDPEDVRTGKVKLNAWDKENLRNLYMGEVAYTDQEVGVLLDYLRTEGVLDRAVVVILSDHGEEFWDHGGFEHGHTQHEELVRVPLMVRFPHGAHGGQCVETPVRLMDLMPTLHEYLDLEQPTTYQGRSFFKVIEAKDKGPEGPFFFEHCLYGSEKKALRVKNLKLIMDMETEEASLFDLAADPGEKQDLSETRPEDTDHLKKRLLLLEKKLKTDAQNEDAADLSPEDLSILKNLGYVK